MGHGLGCLEVNPDRIRSLFFLFELRVDDVVA